ncbi:hypothetical protein M436DRAFT_63828 [Aureobasidium namibiae CBS 147.97]|uniref:Uncharacterized protein n=1 Tax=Aureobasidium namibiae CBS 147.97 TaxID=1043004 RepID=A0A074WUZ6_9PEZI
MSSEIKQKYLNIVQKNQARALFGLYPFSTSPPPLELGERFGMWFRVEFKRSTARAEKSRCKLVSHGWNLLDSSDLPLHLREEWDDAQPTFDYVDLVLRQNNNTQIPSDTVFGFQWRPDLRPTKKSISPQEQASSSTNADNKNSRERTKEAGDFPSHSNVDQLHSDSSNNGETRSNILVTHDDTVSAPNDIDSNAEDEITVKLNRRSSPDMNGDKFSDNNDNAAEKPEAPLGSDTHLEI